VLSGLAFANACEFQSTSTVTVSMQAVVSLFISVDPLAVEWLVARANSGLVAPAERNV